MMHEELARLEAALEGVEIEYHAQLDSTNNRGLEVARKETLGGPRLIFTEEQTAGRGRGANQWWSASGSLTFSLLVPGDRIVPPTEWPRLSLASGLAVCEVLEALAPAALVGLKWPNDVFLGGKKICGILIESVVTPQPCLIVGIGLNVNNSFRSAPAELQATATSLVDELHLPQDRLAILVSLIKHWQRRQTELQLSRASVAAAWQRYCVLTGQVVRVDQPAGNFTGRCTGIDDYGALLVLTESGLERVMAGTVRLV